MDMDTAGKGNVPCPCWESNQELVTRSTRSALSTLTEIFQHPYQWECIYCNWVLKRKKVENCGLDSSGSQLGPMAGFCGHGYKSSRLAKDGELF